MMISKEAFETHRKKLVEAAARLFRAKGIGGVSLADVSRAAGLTHGGFYNHFASKDELACAAADHASEQNNARFAVAPDSRAPMRALATSYLSSEHRDDAGDGCVIAAIGPEAARGDRSLRDVLTATMDARFDRIASRLEGTPKQRRARAIVKIAGMLGTLLLARIATNEELSNEILAAGRAAYG